MDGDTVVEPFANRSFTTRYRAAFVLAGWNRGAWRPALRLDHFSTRDPSAMPGEHGNAVTAALNWRPQDWLRLTLEALHIDSTRTVRADYGLPPRSRGTQVQLSARLFY
jgi:phosphate-selective porin